MNYTTKNLETGETGSFYSQLPMATTEKAGCITAADKMKIDKMSAENGSIYLGKLNKVDSDVSIPTNNYVAISKNALTVPGNSFNVAIVNITVRNINEIISNTSITIGAGTSASNANILYTSSVTLPPLAANTDTRLTLTIPIMISSENERSLLLAAKSTNSGLTFPGSSALTNVLFNANFLKLSDIT